MRRERKLSLGLALDVCHRRSALDLLLEKPRIISRLLLYGITPGTHLDGHLHSHIIVDLPLFCILYPFQRLVMAYTTNDQLIAQRAVKGLTFHNGIRRQFF